MRTFTYDAMDPQETGPDTGTVSYVYDANGNRLSRTANGHFDYYGYDQDDKDRLLWINRDLAEEPTAGQTAPYTLFGYDTNGRMTRREQRTEGGPLHVYDFTWNSDDRLTQVKEGTTVLYDAEYGADGLRTSKFDEAGEHTYTWGLGGVVLEEIAGPNGTTKVTHTPGLAQRTTDPDNNSDNLALLGPETPAPRAPAPLPPNRTRTAS